MIRKFVCLALVLVPVSQSLSSPTTLETEAELAKALVDIGVKVEYTNGHVSAVELQRSSQVTAQHVKSLSRFAELSELDIPSTLITNEVIAYMNEIPNLRKLSIQTREGPVDQVLDLEPLSRVKFLQVMGFDHLTDTWFEKIRMPKDLEGFSFLFAPKITDQSLRRLQSLANLRRLDIDCRQVTDAGLLSLTESSKIKELHLYDSAVTGSAFHELPWIPQLERVSWRVSATDKGVAALQRCDKLASLDLSKSSVSDAAVETVASFKSLAQLFLDQTKVTDQGLARLAKQTRLQQLYLSGCEKVTDDGIVHLSALTELKRLAVDGTKVTSAGAKKLKMLLPSVSIVPARLLE